MIRHYYKTKEKEWVQRLHSIETFDRFSGIRRILKNRNSFKSVCCDEHQLTVLDGMSLKHFSLSYIKRGRGGPLPWEGISLHEKPHNLSPEECTGAGGSPERRRGVRCAWKQGRGSSSPSSGPNRQNSRSRHRGNLPPCGAQRGMLPAEKLPLVPCPDAS